MAGNSMGKGGNPTRQLIWMGIPLPNTIKEGIEKKNLSDAREVKSLKVERRFSRKWEN